MNRYSASNVLTTSPEQMGVFLDTLNYHRLPEWAELPEELKLTKAENPNALLAFVNSLPVSKRNLKNPIVNFWRDSALANYTQLTADLAVDSTTLSVEDAVIFNAGHVAVNARTGEEYPILSVNATNNTILLESGGRGKFGPAFAGLIGDEIRPANPVVGERGTMKDSYSTYPGDPCQNFITLAGLKFGMSTMQRNSVMKSEWGTWDKVELDAKYQLDSLVQEAMIVQNRWSGYDETEKMIYRGAGFLHQLSGNRLDLGTRGTNFLWEHINDFTTPMFVSDNSSDRKMIFSGPAIWADALSTSRQNSMMDSDQLFVDPTSGATQFVMYTTEGKQLVWNKVTGFEGYRSNLALVLDENCIGGGQFEGLGPQTFYGLQANNDVLGEDAAVFTSWEVHYTERSTGGIILGGTRPVIA